MLLLHIILFAIQQCYCYSINNGPPIIYAESQEIGPSSRYKYQYHPDMANVVEGDILLSLEQMAIFKENGWKGLLQSEAWRNVRMWGTTIPYEIEDGVDADTRANILSSIGLFAPTCLQFVERGPTNMDVPYMRFRPPKLEPNCYTSLGMPESGPRDIFLNSSICPGAAEPAHAIFHALGRWHEQSRPDRDQFVNIHSQNFDSTNRLISFQFEKQDSADTLGLPYDFDSITHYPATAFQKAPGLNTITPKDSTVALRRLGQTKKLSPTDINHVKIRYCNISLTEIWPRGKFSLYNTVNGCPASSRQGWRCTDDEQSIRDSNRNDASNPIHIKFDRLLKPETCIYYCSFTKSSGGRDWPPGSYCVARKGGSCPSGFDEGSVYWDNEDRYNYNRVSGKLPDGVYDCDTLIYYCCRNDSSIDVPIALPTATPFVLLRESASGCQQVQNMTVSEEWLFTDDENTSNENELSGHHPYVEGTTDFKIFFCYYS